MKVEELMIGNYISDIHASESSYWQVKQLLGKVCYYGDYYSEEYENLKPIPLTEEWLVRFGFENCINGWWSENELFNVKFIDNDIEIYLSGSDNDLAYKKIKYVHQIQNLYYIIIGEHLTIK